MQLKVIVCNGTENAGSIPVLHYLLNENLSYMS